MGEGRSAYKILIGKLKGRDHLEDLGVVGRLMLECVLEKQGIETNAAKAFRTFKRSHSLFRSRCSNATIKLTLHKALIRLISKWLFLPGISWQTPIF